MVEHWSSEPKVAGSSPAAVKPFYATFFLAVNGKNTVTVNQTKFFNDNFDTNVAHSHCQSNLSGSNLGF
jgi:hypothetical protein